MSLVPRPRSAGELQAPSRAPDSPLGTFPRRIAGEASDGRRWELLVASTGISAVMAGTTVGEAHIWTGDDRLTVEFWVDGGDFPGALGAHLVEQVFAHPALGRPQPILVCLPRRDAGLLEHVLRRVTEAHTRAAGMTCLVEGTVGREAPAQPAPRRRAPV